MLGKLRCTFNPKFSLDVLAMKGDRLGGDAENESEFFGCLSFRDQLQDFALAGGEAQRGGGARRIGEPLQVFARKPGRDVDAAVEDAFNCAQELFARGGFQDISGCARRKRGPDRPDCRGW